MNSSMVPTLTLNPFKPALRRSSSHMLMWFCWMCMQAGCARAVRMLMTFCLTCMQVGSGPYIYERVCALLKFVLGAAVPLSSDCFLLAFLLLFCSVFCLPSSCVRRTGFVHRPLLGDHDEHQRREQESKEQQKQATVAMPSKRAGRSAPPPGEPDARCSLTGGG